MSPYRRQLLAILADRLEHVLWSHTGEFGSEPEATMSESEACLYALCQRSLSLLESLLDEEGRRGPRPRHVPSWWRSHTARDSQPWHDREQHEAEAPEESEGDTWPPLSPQTDPAQVYDPFGSDVFADSPAETTPAAPRARPSP